MPIAALFLTTGIILGSWWLLFATRRGDRAGTAGLYAGLMTAGQIVLTELALAASGRLDRSSLIGINLIGVAACVLLAFQRRSAAAPRCDDRPRRGATLAAMIRWEIVLLVLLAVVAFAWLVAAAVFLPAQSIDDLAFHLPPLYQALQTHRLDLLPVGLRDAFAFPFNAELLTLWPLAFLGADALTELVQLAVAVYGVLAIYALARRLDVEARVAAFAGLLFLFVPVVLGLCGSNGSELTAGVFHLVLLCAAIAFYQTGDRLHLLMAAVASGFLLGVRYSMILSVAFLQPLLWLRFRLDGNWARGLRSYGLYLLVLLPLAAYWPVRNYQHTGHPLYPLEVTSTGLQLLPESTLAQIVHPNVATLLGAPATLWGLVAGPVQDAGLGTSYGGLGVVFWGLCLPALIYCLLQAARSMWTSQYAFPFLVWAQAIAAIAAPLLTPTEALDFAPRTLIFVVGIGLVALATVFAPVTTLLRGSGLVLRAFATAASVFAVTYLAAYQQPAFQIEQAIDDWRGGRYVSEFAYMPQTGSDVAALSEVWAPLDYLTRDGPGWKVSIAASQPAFWTTPAFGSRLQNRIWNFDSPATEPPDALIFHRDQRRLPFFYVGGRIAQQDVAADGRYELIAQTPSTKLWVKRELLDRPEIAAKLADYYIKQYGALVSASEGLLPALVDSNAVFMTSTRLGYGMRYLDLTGKFPGKVVLVPENAEAAFADRLGAKSVYTIGKPLPGYEARNVAMMNSPRGQVLIYLNTRT